MGRHLPKYQGKEKKRDNKETVHQKQKKERGKDGNKEAIQMKGKEGSKEAVHESKSKKNQGLKVQ